jgi:hypothetical protein
MSKSQQERRRIFILNNQYEILAMIPIAVFAAARSFTTHDDIIVAVGIMFRAQYYLLSFQARSIKRISTNQEKLLKNLTPLCSRKDLNVDYY